MGGGGGRWNHPVRGAEAGGVVVRQVGVKNNTQCCLLELQG